MSRIGNKPITLPAGVDVAVEDRSITVKGPKGSLQWRYPEAVEVSQDDGVLKLTRRTDAKQDRAYHGLARALLSNMVTGVSTGFKKELQIVGVGYRAELKGKNLILHLGYSHPVEYQTPEGAQISVPEPTSVVVEGIDKQIVGQVAAEIRSKRPPESYKGKGIRYHGEYVRRKAGKSAVGSGA